MKVKGPGGVSPSSTKKVKKSSASGTGFAKSVDASSGQAPASEVRNIGGAAPISGVDALLSLQEMPDATGGRSKGLLYGKDMLEHLESIRRDILLGAIPKARLKALSDTIKRRRDQFQDPGLADVLDQIELRARVELAKLEVSG